MRVPKEHGAWAMLYVPYVAGLLAAGREALAHGPGLLLLLGAVSGAFLGRESLLAWWRARDRGRIAREDGRDAVWQLGGALGCGVGALALGPRIPLALLGACGAAVLATHVVQMRRREARTVLGEILAIFGLTLACPAAHAVASGEWSVRALALWLLCILFFASSVLHVKQRVLAAQPRRVAERRALRIASGVYHGLLALGLVALVAAGRLHVALAVAFLPVVLRALLALGGPAAKPNLVRAGILEIVWSLHFLFFLTWASWRSA